MGFITHKVVVEYDGCSNWEPAHPDARGSLMTCKDFVSRFLPPEGCTFGIVDLASGRQVSYMVTPVARPRQLHMRGCKDIS